MRLTYLTPEAPREGQASYVHVHEIIAGLKRRGWDVELYQPSYTANPVSPGLVPRLISCLWMQVLMWMRWRRGSVLYIRAHYMAFPSAFIAHILKIPVFHEINGPYEDVFVTYPSLSRVRNILIPLQRWQFKRATALIAVTKDLCNWVSQESGGRPVSLIPNGANTTVFRPGLARPADAPNDDYAVFFGGLARWHGVPDMIAAAENPQWPAGVKLLVIGEGQCSDMLREAAARNKHIVALGRKPYRDVPAYVAGALAGLVPIGNPGKRSETGLMPLKLFETMACGIPVIVTDFPGQADLVRENDCGVVIPPGDSVALAQAVARLAADKKTAQAMGERGFNIVEKEHSWDVRAAETDNYIRKHIIL